MNEIRDKINLLGLCHKCGEAADWYYCEDCREAINESRRNRKLIKFRNCYCGQQATAQRDGSFFCTRHFNMERAREFQDPAVTAENIRQSNIESEKRRYTRLKDAGICVTCAKREAYFGCIRCTVCQEKRRELKRRSKGKSIANADVHPWKAGNTTIFMPSRRRVSALAAVPDLNIGAHRLRDRNFSSDL